MFSHGVWGIGGHTHHVQFSICGLEVHIVVSCTAQGQQTGSIFGQILNHRAVDHVVHENAHHRIACRQSHGSRVKPFLEIADFKAKNAVDIVKRAPVIGLGVKERNFRWIR